MTLNAWVVLGETGISSMTMWAAITGAVEGCNRRLGRFDIPYDSADFSRCYKFWKQCELTEDDLNKVKEVFPFWKPFIENWGTLVNLYEAKDHDTLYKYLHELQDEIE